MSNLNFFYTDKPTGKFIALFSDGSGGDIFMEVGKKDGITQYVDSHGELIEDETYFEDCGYGFWLQLPDDFELWCERVPV